MLPQCTFCSVEGSLTVNLSCGDRPVCCPVRATSGPSDARTASFRRIGNLVQNRRAQVPVDASGPNDAKGLETMRPLNLCAHLETLLGKKARKTKNASTRCGIHANPCIVGPAVNDRANLAVFHD